MRIAPPFQGRSDEIKIIISRFNIIPRMLLEIIFFLFPTPRTRSSQLSALRRAKEEKLKDFLSGGSRNMLISSIPNFSLCQK